MKVFLGKAAKKALNKLPVHIVDNFYDWMAEVEENGLEATRKIPGYHDEPLDGEREGERSIRLSRKWRAIYIEKIILKPEGVYLEAKVEPNEKVVIVLEVLAHDYRTK